MKVLFLDFDGVLNSAVWFRRRRDVCPKEKDTPEKRAMWAFDPDAIERLNQVVERTGAKVVVSSTWRIGVAALWAEIPVMLSSRGFRGEVIGRTPYNLSSDEIIKGETRGTEIGVWLARNPGVEKFAIVDDDSDMGPLMPHLVHTSFETGMLDTHVEQLVVMLGEL